MKTVVCDDCNKKFEIKKLKEKKHPKGVVETYFKCPHCQKKYIAFVTDQEARKTQHQIKKLYASLPQIKDLGDYDEEFQRKYRNHLSEI